MELGLRELGAMVGKTAARVVYAPAPILPPSAALPPNSVVSVVLEAGEGVAWTWTSDVNGARYVSGYTIFRPRRTAKSRSATAKLFRNGRSQLAISAKPSSWDDFFDANPEDAQGFLGRRNDRPSQKRKFFK